MDRLVLASVIAASLSSSPSWSQQAVPQAKRPGRLSALPLSLTPYRKNYILLASYDPHLSELASSEPDGENKDTEIKFQLSLCSRLLYSVYFAYTNLSHWQVYDVRHSSPFRTTDHEPELFWLHRFDGLELHAGVTHQSNGEGGSESRAWNRAFVEGLWEGVTDFDSKEDQWGLSLRVWAPFKVAEENSDIADYLGYFELRGEWLVPRWKQLVTFVLRNNLERENRGSFELDYSLDFFGKTRLLFQLFNGYGESLLEYDDYAQRVGVGLEFSP